MSKLSNGDCHCLGDGGQHQFEDVRSWKRSQFYEAVDVLTSTIDWRLDEQSLQPALTLEQLLTNATSNPVIDENLLSKVNSYHPHLIAVALKTELALPAQHNITPTIADIINWFNEVDFRRDTHKSMYLAVATLLVLPTTTASCERSFSGLRRLKTYLRSTVTQEKLNSMIIAAAHRDLLDSINIEPVAREFVSLHDSRRKMYGSFT